MLACRAAGRATRADGVGPQEMSAGTFTPGSKWPPAHPQPPGAGSWWPGDLSLPLAPSVAGVPDTLPGDLSAYCATHGTWPKPVDSWRHAVPDLATREQQGFCEFRGWV